MKFVNIKNKSTKGLKMKKIILVISMFTIINSVQAEYVLKIPLEQSKGGALPNGSITITPKTPGLPTENWQPTEPLYSEWVNFGTYYGCDNEKWTGNKSGNRYDAINSTCKLNQTRTIQEREMEQTMLTYRNTGPEKTEERILLNQTYRNIGECMYANDASNPSYYNLWYWSEPSIIVIIDNITYYAKGIRVSPNGQAKGFSVTDKVNKASLYNPDFKAESVYFKGDYKTQIGGSDFYELCFIDI